MANTYTLIATVTATAPVSFTSIPQTFTHLVVRYSSRNGGGGGTPNPLTVNYNGGTTSSMRYYGVNTTPTTFASNDAYLIQAGGGSTASYDGQGDLWIFNYSSSAGFNKCLSTLCGSANTTGGASHIEVTASKTAENSAITSLTIAGGTQDANATFSLYGIE
jgi:hypothetical protein